MIFPRRKVFEFTHPEAKGPAIFRAWSEKAAWRKMRSFVRSMMFGDWALTYDPAALECEMAKIKCSQLSAGEKP